MHSGRMRTVRCSGCLGVCVYRGCLSRGCLPRVCVAETRQIRGRHPPPQTRGRHPPGKEADSPPPTRGRHPGTGGSACWDTHPLWTEFLTHACENIYFPQLRLRTVINTILYAFLNLPQGENGR